MICSCQDQDTDDLFHDLPVPRFHAIQQVARRKLLMLHAATNLSALRVPPGNRLEKLSGDRKDQYSIRINDRWRICFKWIDGNCHDVEICDYH